MGLCLRVPIKFPRAKKMSLGFPGSTVLTQDSPGVRVLVTHLHDLLIDDHSSIALSLLHRYVP